MGASMEGWGKHVALEQVAPHGFDSGGHSQRKSRIHLATLKQKQTQVFSEGIHFKQ